MQISGGCRRCMHAQASQVGPPRGRTAGGDRCRWLAGPAAAFRSSRPPLSPTIPPNLPRPLPTSPTVARRRELSRLQRLVHVWASQGRLQPEQAIEFFTPGSKGQEPGAQQPSADTAGWETRASGVQRATVDNAR